MMFEIFSVDFSMDFQCDFEESAGRRPTNRFLQGIFSVFLWILVTDIVNSFAITQ